MTMHDGHRARAGWAPFLAVGRRVVLRYAIDAQTSPHGESMTDALGTVVGSDERSVQVMTRRGANILMEVGATLATATSIDVTNDVLAALNSSLPTISTTAPATQQPQGR